MVFASTPVKYLFRLVLSCNKTYCHTNGCSLVLLSEKIFFNRDHSGYYTNC
jgi:hypothetical protein